MQELEALDKLEHPHVVRVIDICEDSENIYVVHELMIHGTLKQKLARIQEQRVSLSEQDVARMIY